MRGHQARALPARTLRSDKPLDRRSLAAELFPDAVDPLGSLRWCLAALRRAIGSSETLTGDPVRIDLPEGTEVDVLALRDGKTVLPDQTGDLLEGYRRAHRRADLCLCRERDLPLAIEWLEQAGRTEQANALSRELLSLAARTHMDSFIPKALQIIDGSAA